jgi:programmed cell death 6-interacting protein
VVKSIPPTHLDPTPDVQALFRGVVPDSSAKAISKYTDLVDGLVRTQAARLDAASDEARLRLREWELPESLQALEPGSSVALPEGVRLELEKIEGRGGAAHLLDLVAQIKVRTCF